MQINHTGIKTTVNTKQNTADKTDTPTDNQAKKHDTGRVQLSQEAKELKQLENRIATTPDIDQQKMTQIKEAIDQGTYHINADSIASKLLNGDNR